MRNKHSINEKTAHKWETSNKYMGDQQQINGKLTANKWKIISKPMGHKHQINGT